MPDRSRQRRSPARFLAPLALLAVVAGIYLIVHHGLATKHPSRTAQTQTTPPSPGRTTTTTTRTTTHRTSRGSSARSYVVRPGDNLDVISQRTGVSVQTIETLNPGISATALRVGQRLTLRR